MGRKFVHIAGRGPRIYDEDKHYDPDAQYVYSPFSGSPVKSLSTDGQIQITQPPSLGDEVVRWDDIGGMTFITPQGVADILNPDIGELVPLSDAEGSILIVYQDTNPDIFTIYLWDDDYAGADDSPYVIKAAGAPYGELVEGAWVAVAGAYQLGARTIKGAMSVTDRLQITGNVLPASGIGLEIGVTGGSTLLMSYDRDTPAYIAAIYNALSHQFSVSGAAKVTISSTGINNTGTYSVSGNQVVSARQAAVSVIPHAAGANPTAAEYDALVDAFNDLVTKLSSASGHGLLT